MAFNIDPSISLNAKSPSLSDILNTATSIQQFKQNQVLNPLIQDIYKSKSELSKYDVLNAHFDNIIKNSADLQLDPDLNKEKIVNRIYELEKTAPDGPNPNAVKQIISTIPENASKTDYQTWLANMQLKTLDAKSRNEKQYPAGSLPGQLPNVSYQGNQNQQNQPQQQTQNQVVQQNQGVTQDQMNLPDYSQPVKYQYPKRDPNTPYLPLPTEAEDTKSGNAYRTGLINTQSNLTTTKANYDYLIGKITDLAKKTGDNPGLTGKWAANIKNWANDADYKQLSKDIANAQIAQMQANGESLSTDKGKDLLAHSTGDSTYPPKVLAEIAYRNKAQTYNYDLQATAAQKFAINHGDNNMKSFQTMWNKNADDKIFAVMAINDNSKLTPEQKQSEVAKIIGTDSKKIKMFNEKYNNIKKLTLTGEL